jgi:hypothetical protein
LGYANCLDMTWLAEYAELTVGEVRNGFPQRRKGAKEEKNRGLGLDSGYAAESAA